MALVELNSVGKSYPRRVGLRTETHTVVQDVSFTIETGETLGLVGESGSGKTTVARMILGLIQPSGGVVRVDGVDVGRATRAQMRRLRREMQPVFQDPYAALNPRMNVLEIVTEPWVIYRRELARERGGLDRGSDRANGLGAGGKAGGVARRGDARAAPGGNTRDTLRAGALELLAEVGLDESALARHPHEFSGGQRQRINIARALALRPKLLILDEPVSALDVSVGAQIVNLLRRLQREHGLTYLFISHSMPLVRYLSTRIAVMERGRLVEMGETEALCARPAQAYTRQLIAATPELPAAVG
jgi:ABC-type oligopeptide transport system ATPase subunit